MNRQAQGVVLLLLGGAALKAGLTDMHLRYVKEVLQPFLVAASVLMLAVGAMTLWYEWRAHRGPDVKEPARAAAPPGSSAASKPAQEPAQEPAGSLGRAEDAVAEVGVEAGHGHHREPRVGWLLVAPVLGLLLVAPPALGSYAVSTTGAALSRDQISELPPLPEHLDPVPLPVLDYVARALWDEEGTLFGHRLELTGFLVTNPREEEQFLARLVLSCCAADARPVKVGLAGEVPVGLPDDTWVEVIGEYADRTTVDPINESTIPYLHVESWQEVPPPRQPYE